MSYSSHCSLSKIYTVIYIILTLCSVSHSWDFVKAGADWPGKCHGPKQSPIDISLPFTYYKPNLSFSYSKMQTEYMYYNDGNNLIVEGDFGFMNYNDVTYLSSQILLYSPSFHTINNKRYPLEMQIIHHDKTGKQLTVCVMFKESEADYSTLLGKLSFDNESLQKMVPYTPIRVSEQINLSKYVHEGQDFFIYEGVESLPPCEKQNTVLILTDIVNVSKKQLANFPIIIKGNNRIIQHRQYRHIYTTFDYNEIQKKIEENHKVVQENLNRIVEENKIKIAEQIQILKANNSDHELNESMVENVTDIDTDDEKTPEEIQAELENQINALNNLTGENETEQNTNETVSTTPKGTVPIDLILDKAEAKNEKSKKVDMKLLGNGISSIETNKDNNTLIIDKDIPLTDDYITSQELKEKYEKWKSLKNQILEGNNLNPSLLIQFSQLEKELEEVQYFPYLRDKGLSFKENNQFTSFIETDIIELKEHLNEKMFNSINENANFTSFGLNNTEIGNKILEMKAKIDEIKNNETLSRNNTEIEKNNNSTNVVDNHANLNVLGFYSTLQSYMTYKKDKEKEERIEKKNEKKNNHCHQKHLKKEKREEPKKHKEIDNKKEDEKKHKKEENIEKPKNNKIKHHMKKMHKQIKDIPGIEKKNVDFNKYHDLIQKVFKHLSKIYKKQDKENYSNSTYYPYLTESKKIKISKYSLESLISFIRAIDGFTLSDDEQYSLLLNYTEFLIDKQNSYYILKHLSPVEKTSNLEKELNPLAIKILNIGRMTLIDPFSENIITYRGFNGQNIDYVALEYLRAKKLKDIKRNTNINGKNGEGRPARDINGEISPRERALKYNEVKCSDNFLQSPININGPYIAEEQAIKFSFITPKKNVTISNDGYKILVKGKFGSFSHEQQEYKIREIHIHTPSEHTFGDNETRAVMELQIIGREKGNSSNIAAIASLFDYGNKTNQVLSAFGFDMDNTFFALNLSRKMDVVITDPARLAKMNLNYAIGASAKDKKVHFVTYYGTLTSPPCGKPVKWFVILNRLPITRVQAQYFKTLFGKSDNVRRLQLSHNRLLKVI